MPSFQEADSINLEALPSLSTDVDFSSLRLVFSLTLKGTLPFLSQSPHVFASVRVIRDLSMNATGATSLLLGGFGTRVLHSVNVEISNEPRVLDFSGLLLTRIGTLHVDNCSSLRTLAGATAEWQALRLEIFNCPSLQMLLPQGPFAFDSIASILLRDCPQLRSLAGLEGLDQVDDTLELTNLPSLLDLSGLSGLIQVDTFTVSGCDSLQSVHGFDEFKSAGTISVTRNKGLKTLDGLDLLEHADKLVVKDNLDLESISALRLIRNVRSVTFRDNPLLCCPSYAFFAETKISPYDVECRRCYEYGVLSPQVGPRSGGIMVTLPYTGVLPYEYVKGRLLTRLHQKSPPSRCVVEQLSESETDPIPKGQIRCMLLAVQGMEAEQGNRSDSDEQTADVEVIFPNSIWYAIGQNLTLIPFAEWARIADSPVRVVQPLNDTSSIVVTEAPGIPEPATAKANTAAMIIVATFGYLSRPGGDRWRTAAVFPACKTIASGATVTQAGQAVGGAHTSRFSAAVGDVSTGVGGRRTADDWCRHRCHRHPSCLHRATVHRQHARTAQRQSESVQQPRGGILQRRADPLPCALLWSADE
jgi:hypothetical protein